MIILKNGLKKKYKMKCRITNKQTHFIHDFGKMPIANNFLDKKNNFNDEFFFNLGVSFSEDISLLQLTENPNPEEESNNKTKKEDSTAKAKNAKSKNVESKADTSIKDAGTTNLGALLKAKLDDKK